MAGDAIQFADIRRLLTDAGYLVADSNYSPESFGSWWILLSAKTSHRLVWDGKDQWLILQREAGRSAVGESKWEDVWVKKDASESTPDDLVQYIRESVE